jgi:malate dehydrogenase (quinone)
VLQKVFKDKVATPAGQEKLHQIVPSYGTQVAAPVAAPASADKAKAPKANAASDMAL